MDIRSPTYGKFPHYAFHPPFHSTFPLCPFCILPTATVAAATHHQVEVLYERSNWGTPYSNEQPNFYWQFQSQQSSKVIDEITSTRSEESSSISGVEQFAGLYGTQDRKEAQQQQHYIVEADSVNSFKSRLGKSYWANQEFVFNFNSELIGTGGLPVCM